MLASSQTLGVFSDAGTIPRIDRAQNSAARRMSKSKVTLVIGLSRLPELSEQLQRDRGDIRSLVLQRIRAGKHPSPKDLAAALRQTPPDPAEHYVVSWTPEELAVIERATAGAPPAEGLNAWAAKRITEERKREALERRRRVIADDEALLKGYVAATYVLGRPRTPGRTTPARSHRDKMRIAAAFFAALDRARQKHPKNPSWPVKQRVASRFKISTRTLETIIKGVRAEIIRD